MVSLLLCFQQLQESYEQHQIRLYFFHQIWFIKIQIKKTTTLVKIYIPLGMSTLSAHFQLLNLIIF